MPAVSAWLDGLLSSLFADISIRSTATIAQGRSLIDALPAPDLALIDLGLPDGSGTELIGLLRARHPSCITVVTTLFADDAHLFPALRAGAHGCLLKDQPQERIVASLQGILDGEPALSPAIAQRLLRIFNAPEIVTEENIALTPREREVLTLIAKGARLPDLVVKLGISRHTAADHLKNVYRKLDVNSRAEATLQAVRLGLVQQSR